MKIFLALMGVCTIAQAQHVHPAQLPTPRQSLDERAGFGSPFDRLPPRPLLVNPEQILTGVNPQLLLIQARQTKEQGLQSEVRRHEQRLAQLKEVIATREAELKALREADGEDAADRAAEGEEQLKVLRAAMRKVAEQFEQTRRELKQQQDRRSKADQAKKEPTHRDAEAKRQAQMLEETKRRLAASQQAIRERLSELVAQQKSLEAKKEFEEQRRAVAERLAQQEKLVAASAAQKQELEARRQAEEQKAAALKQPEKVQALIAQKQAEAESARATLDRKRQEDERAAAQRKIEELKAQAAKKRAEAEAMRAAEERKHAEENRHHAANAAREFEHRIHALRAELQSVKQKFGERHPTVQSLRHRLELVMDAAKKNAVADNHRSGRVHREGAASELLEREVHELSRRREHLADRLEEVRDGETREELLAEFNRVRAMEGRVRFQLRSLNRDRDDDHDEHEEHHSHDDEDEHHARHEEEHEEAHHRHDDHEHEHGHHEHDDGHAEWHAMHEHEEHEHEHHAHESERRHIHGRIEALIQAADVLARSGLEDQAHELRRQAEELERELHGRSGHHDRVVGELIENVQILRGEVRELHEKMDQILRLLRQRPGVTGAARPQPHPGVIVQPGDVRVWSRNTGQFRPNPQPQKAGPKNGGVRVYRYIPQKGEGEGTFMYRLHPENRSNGNATGKPPAGQPEVRWIERPQKDHGDRDQKRPQPEKEANGGKSGHEAKEIRREIRVIRRGDGEEDVRVIEVNPESREKEKPGVEISPREIEVEVEVIDDDDVEEATSPILIF